MSDRVTHTFMIILGLSIMLAGGLYARTVEAAPDAPGLIDPFAGDAGPAAAPAPVATSPDPAIDPVGWARSVYDAVRGGRWAMVAGLFLVGVTYATRKWLLPRWRWAQSDRGGLFLVALLAVLGMASNAAIAGKIPDGSAAMAALEALVTAIAAYVAAKKLAKPAS